MNLEALNAVLLENFDEALNAKSGEGWFDGLNPTLAQIDAATASKLPAPGRSSIAAHCEHLRYVIWVKQWFLRLLFKLGRNEKLFVDRLPKGFVNILC